MADKHSFDVVIAAEYGVTAAVMLEHFNFWLTKNKADDRNYHDGLYWTYGSVASFLEIYPYLSKAKITNALKKLETEGVIVSGCYNANAYDRTKWYALTEKGWQLFGKSINENQEIPFQESEKPLTETGNPFPKTGNGFTEIEKPIPVTRTITNTGTNTYTHFDDAWKEYPRKIGRKKAEEAYKRSVKAGADEADILRGVQLFAQKCKAERTEERFIPHGQTFFQGERWRDYLSESEKSVDQLMEQFPGLTEDQIKAAKEKGLL